MNFTKTPIVLITGFKSGTWFMRRVLTEMTGMGFYEPKILPGEKKYYNLEQLNFKENYFYSWHIIPTKDIVEKLNRYNAKTIFVLRNIFDVVVSIYYHFYNDIDADIGRGNSKDKFLKNFNFKDGISLIITGFDEGNGLRWNGLNEIIIHYNEMLKASLLCESIIFDFDNLVQNKINSYEKIDSLLELKLSHSVIENIAEITSFKSMKEQAQINKVGLSHFREGKPKNNRKSLNELHKIMIKQQIKLFAPDMYENAKKVKMYNITQC